MQKIVLVGRHDSKELLENGYDVVATKNTAFLLDVDQCEMQFLELRREAQSLDAALVFQNIPGILAAALLKWYLRPGLDNVPVGVVISRPGPRLAGIQKTFTAFTADPNQYIPDSNIVVDAVKFVNGRAKVELGGIHSTGSGLVTQDIIVTVDPVTPFEFVTVEWFVAPPKEEKKTTMQFPGGL